jgi:hypothetical protein
VRNSPLDLVADESDLFDGLPGRILELPVEVPLAGKDEAHRRIPIVTTTSVASTTSVVGLGELPRKVEPDVDRTAD